MRLVQRMSQRVVMTPLLQQAIHLLQLSTLELKEVVEQELRENPLLEEVQAENEPVAEVPGPETADLQPPPSESPQAKEQSTVDGERSDDLPFDLTQAMFDQPESKAGFRHALEKRSRQIADMGVQEFFIHEVNQKINDQFFTAFFKEKNTFQPRAQGTPWQKKLPPGINTPYRPTSVKAKPIKVSKLLREKALIAALVNYPQLFEEFGEQLGMVNTGNSDYDELRQELIRFLALDGALEENDRIYLDDQAVKQHLIQLGYGKILDALFDKSLYVYAGFAKPGQALETVRQGWLEAYSRGLDKDRWKA